MKKSCVALTICCFMLSAICFMNIAGAVSIPTGDQAPDFTLSSLDGSTYSLSSYRGSLVVLIYFRTDQKHSLLALEELKMNRNKYGKRNVQYIGISAEKREKDELLNRANELNIDFPVLLDEERNVYSTYGIRVYPTTLIVDGEGNVAASLPGHALSYKLRLDSTIRFLLGDIDKSQLEKLLLPEKRVPDASALYAERTYNLALRFTEAQFFDQSIELVKQSIEAKPDMAKSHILLGYLLLDAHDSDNAVEQFETALHIDPSSKDAGTGLGAALIEKGDTGRAIQVLSEALFLNPKPERTLYELGRAYELQGEKENAAEMYKKSLEKIVGHHILPSSVGHCR